MNLDLVNDLFNNLKENKLVQNFIKELSNYFEKNSKDNLKCENKGIPIIEEILSKNNFTTANQNSIRWNLNDVISKYEQNSSNDALYFIKDENSNFYNVLKAEGGQIEEIEINKKDIPIETKINDVLKIKDNQYVIDDVSTKELKKNIKNMAKEILNNQNINLDKHRKEGHLYMVTEELGNNRFLWDLTDAPKTEFEEPYIPKDLLNTATEGIVLKYTNGKYEYYSDDGFERAEKIHSSS